MTMTDNKLSAQKLTQWYESQKRPLPWRKNRDPYPIWISEIMLQQTTTKAVIDYFHRFINRFPDVKSLAEATIEDVYEQWAGLGYYSRARNIHKASQVIASSGFPKTYQELLALPGFGPYTARAVASQAFDQKVGVVDGNVIRVYTRIFNFQDPWWNTATQNKIQSWADDLCQFENPSDLNQALMELGATVCTPKSPSCLLCPWSNQCQSFKAQTQSLIPLPRPKKAKEIWVWTPEVYFNSKNEMLLVENNDVAFLSKKWVFPGRAEKVKTKPKIFTYKHGITHHEIYVCVQKAITKPKLNSTTTLFIKPDQLSQKSPFALMKKAMDYL